MANRNKSKRNRRSVLAFLAPTVIPFEREHMAVGVVYRYRYGGWLFALRADGTLETDAGRGINRLRRDYKCSSGCHGHWFGTERRKLKRTNIVL